MFWWEGRIFLENEMFPRFLGWLPVSCPCYREWLCLWKPWAPWRLLMLAASCKGANYRVPGIFRGEEHWEGYFWYSSEALWRETNQSYAVNQGFHARCEPSRNAGQFGKWNLRLESQLWELLEMSRHQVEWMLWKRYSPFRCTKRGMVAVLSAARLHL